MKTAVRSLLLLVVVLLLWQGVIIVAQLPGYFLPSPRAVAQALWHQRAMIVAAAGVTLLEMLAGFAVATLLGGWMALTLAYWRGLRLSLLPILVFSQAIPTFAVAPLLIVWLGYGLSSKIAIIVLMLFFPIMTAFLDGLLAPRPDLMAMAQLMEASRWQRLWQLQLPAALPKFATGLRVAAAGAPLAAVVGEWVGANQGLGYLLLEANARLQMDLVFAVLVVLVGLSLALYFSIDNTLKRCITW